MPEITEQEYELFQKLKTILIHSQPGLHETFFICGQTGEKDNMGLPEHILVCPAVGLDGMAQYTKTKDYSAPGW
jgi:hypothetical protein